MQRILYFILIAVIAFSKADAQTTPSDKHIMDSLLQNDDMIKMIDNLDKPSSYFRINMGIGNKLYSIENKSITSLQNTNLLILSPSIAYNHKSGFGISFTGFLLNQDKKTAFYQYTLTPSFLYNKGKVADASISYTHYFEKEVYSPNTSPVQNEFYSTLVFKKSWIKPGIAVGYSSGMFRQIVHIDTSLKVANRRVSIKYTDTALIKVSSFSVSASMEHSFNFFKLFSAKDGLVFTPQVSIISGENGYKVNHNSSIENYNAFTKKQITRLRHFQTQSDNKKYQLQSTGLDLDAYYAIGKFYIEPEIYFDYYFPKTTDNRFTQIYNLNIGITF
ncbi:MAG: hypothetical protein ABIY62_05505 [Ginsengibacter sp.]